MGELILRLLESPPKWMMAIILVLITGVALREIIEISERLNKDANLVAVLELLMVLVLGSVLFHSLFEYGLHVQGEAQTFIAMIVFVVATFLSLVLFLAVKEL